MPTNEALIESHLSSIAARAEALQLTTQGYLQDLNTASMSYITLNELITPQTFTVPSMNPVDVETTVAASFETGVAYPQSSDLMTLTAEAATGIMTPTIAPVATWAVTLDGLRALLREEVTATATAFVAALPFPASYLSAMQSMVTDTSARHETDYTLKWQQLIDDTLQLAAHDLLSQGIGIEGVRAAYGSMVSNIVSDYNQAVLGKAETDFRALSEQTDLAFKQGALQLRQKVASAKQTFSVAALEVDKDILALEKGLAEQTDFIRRRHTEYSLSMARSAALCDYTKNALGAARLSHGTFTHYNNTSED